MIDPAKYCSFYNNNLCHVCKQPSENLKRCGNCRSLAYCSKEHQIADWKIHKELCQAICFAENELSDFQVKNYEDFKTIRYMRSTGWEAMLNRPLANFENQIWMHPRVCVVCYSKNVTVDCQKCLNVSYCSKEHQNAYAQIHSKYCDALKLSTEMSKYCMTARDTTYHITASDISHKLKILPKNLEELMLEFSNNPLEKNNGNFQYYITCDYASPTANILYGLEKCGFLRERIFRKRSLTVHIVGADSLEVCWQWIVVLELCFHWIKNLKKVHYILIGPEVRENRTIDNLESGMCSSCKAKNVKAVCTFSSKLYHKVESNLDAPDIIAAFNSGIHGYSEPGCKWLNSIHLLMKRPRVPLILTSYTLSDLKNDVAAVIKNSRRMVNVVVEPQKNPFSNIKPMRDFNSFNVPVFYINGYNAILLGTEENENDPPN